MADPQHCPSPRELDDLELLVSGALAPLTAYDEPDSPVTLGLPADLADAPVVELVDPEGLPLARAVLRADGARDVEALTHAQFGPFRRLYLTPAEVRAGYAGRTVVPVTGPLTVADRDRVAALGPVVLLALVGTGTPELSPVALVRATLAAAATLTDAVVVACPLAAHGDPEVDHELGVQVVSTYAGGPDGDEVVGLPDDPDGELLPEVVDIVAADRPEPADQGLVLFFTGLSGSGKSTLARALVDRLLEQSTRTVTTLDGDVVRRHLSAGLTFSRADRETNIRRIGWVAAEISRHGGVAVCSPIAPFDATRQDVRAMADDAGGAFFLVHVATPLEECERRDRKGLYAKARRGEIPDFTGISSPYEVPADADVVVDTTGRTIEDALGDVERALADAGYLDLVPASRGLDSSSPRGSAGSTTDAIGGRAARSASDERVETPQAVQLPRSPGLDSPSPGGSAGGSRAGEGRAESKGSTSGGGLAPTTETTEPLDLLFVCTANICRSPFMEQVARLVAEEVGASVRVASAGTHGFVDHTMDEHMGSELAGRGGDPTAFRSRPLTRAMVERADLVLTAEAAHRQLILEEQPAALRKVVTLGQAAATVDELDPGLSRAEVVAELGRRRAADAAYDVDDPYRRGPEAAAEAARRIEALVRTVVTALA